MVTENEAASSSNGGSEGGEKGGKKITMEEMAGHNSSGDLWMLIDGKGE